MDEKLGFWTIFASKMLCQRGATASPYNRFKAPTNDPKRTPHSPARRRFCRLSHRHAHQQPFESSQMAARRQRHAQNAQRALQPPRARLHPCRVVVLPHQHHAAVLALHGSTAGLR